ncbi:DNA phosphorothioation system sulfurtransferase DndC [Microcoleus sp. LEGE 07076]|uniref:DNA phosphorothioation system sulfurtransferase DndC n=1 Tax=Microcoleus sp. LEGE 07076 TaxID=915322 RepID=UPI0018805514|nr:DNA phosphorothioation system sulfurtransferase DndC [Microcoleus sp. LEGE 07076]MBE9186213.1 DNA phosphorothioation system sulfurtransferase DndC [Microcoleus sp. LEGE 07076]
MTETMLPLFPPRTVRDLVEEIKQLSQEIRDLYCLDDIPWVVGYSGGKDSTTVVQLIWYAIAELPAEKRTKKIYIITTDTLVENPIVSTWVRQSLKQMKSAAIEQQLPIEPHMLYPDVKDTFWVNLMGKGYPAPRHGFRWCTERLKILPSNRFVRDVVRINGEVILILGTRKAESIKRAASMEKHEIGRMSDRLNDKSSSIKSLLYQSPSLPNSLIYSPIEDWRTDEVWIYLNQWSNPWENSNKDLFTMYRGATADNECPLVVDTSTPSCGSSRFGCWVCTMVSQDKSMEAMIQNDEEKEWMQPLLDIRNELDIKDDRPKRDFRRIYGRVELFERNMGDDTTSVEPIPGPYTKFWREHWLRRVLEAQTKIRKTAPEEMRDITLITPEELSEIRRIWLEQKHEFDDSLPRIYEEVTGEPFEDSRPAAERKLLGSDEWTAIAEICSEDKMHLELMAKLLDTERQYYTKPRRTGIYADLDKCFETSSRSEKEAIGNAHYQRNLKTAVEAVKANPTENIQQVKDAIAKTNASAKNDTADIAKLKQELESNSSEGRQLSWADIKYSTPNSAGENSKD